MTPHRSSTSRSGPSWRQFLTAQAMAVLAVDLVHVDTMLLRRIYALIAVEHGSRRTFLVGVSAHPSGAWTTQAARNLLRDLGDRATTLKFLRRDRDSRFTRGFDVYWRRLARHRVGYPPKGPWPAPRVDAIEAVATKYAAGWPPGAPQDRRDGACRRPPGVHLHRCAGPPPATMMALKQRRCGSRIRELRNTDDIRQWRQRQWQRGYPLLATFNI
jgi:hypothetical protein